MFEGQYLCAAGGGWLSMVGPLIWAPTIDPQPEPGGSQARGSHWPRCAPGSHAAGKGRPWRGRTPPTSFPRAPAWAGNSFTRCRGLPRSTGCRAGSSSPRPFSAWGAHSSPLARPGSLQRATVATARLCTTLPTRRTPQPGGPSSKNLEKTTNLPAGGAAGRSGTRGFCKTG